MVAAKIFVSSKGFPKVLENQEKANGKEWAMRDAKHIGNKDSKPSSNKKKDNIRQWNNGAYISFAQLSLSPSLASTTFSLWLFPFLNMLIATSHIQSPSKRSLFYHSVDWRNFIIRKKNLVFVWSDWKIQRRASTRQRKKILFTVKCQFQCLQCNHFITTTHYIHT